VNNVNIQLVLLVRSFEEWVKVDDDYSVGTISYDRIFQGFGILLLKCSNVGYFKIYCTYGQVVRIDKYLPTAND